MHCYLDEHEWPHLRVDLPHEKTHTQEHRRHKSFVRLDTMRLCHTSLDREMSPVITTAETGGSLDHLPDLGWRVRMRRMSRVRFLDTNVS